MGWFEAVLAFLTEYTEEAGAAGGLLAVGGAAWAIIKKPWKKPETVQLDAGTIRQIARDEKQSARNDVAYFIETRKALKAELEAELAEAHAEEKDQLRGRIAELEKQLTDPDAALAEAEKTIADLTARLERMGNEVGGERLAEARAALKNFDYSVADEIFAEVEARQELAVQDSARAAFGRGEVAEAEVRWLDAAEHYERAARLERSYDTLVKAGMFLWRAGRYAEAIAQEEALVRLARDDIVPEDPRNGTALNNLAESYRAVGRYKEAEPLLREAMEIDRKALGKDHPDYAIDLNNLAGLLRDTGRQDEAEPLYREALMVTERALGKEHADYAIRLNNLAEVLRETGRQGEAEPLMREAMEIDRKALGEDHPDYAIDQNNLAGLLCETGRREEAGPLYEQALGIVEAALGAEHPRTKLVRGNLEAFRAGE